MTNTQEGNRIIAEWMKVTVYPEKGTSEYKKWKGERCDYEIHELQYHTSWDWLMPVVEKIELMGYDIVISGYKAMSNGIDGFVQDCTIKGYGYEASNFGGGGKSKIEIVYPAVLRFFQWYNTQNTNQ